MFGVEGGKFLGFLLTERGIEVNPEKCAAIIAMKSPTSVKEVKHVEPSGVQALKNPNPLKDVEALAVLV